MSELKDSNSHSSVKRGRNEEDDDFSKRVKKPEGMPQKITFDLERKSGSKGGGLKLGFSKPAAVVEPKKMSFKMATKPAPKKISLPNPMKQSKPAPAKVAAAFADESDEEEEEMPPEAKMRMKNIGRETPTSSGPNSFGKTKTGFHDSKKLFERKLDSSLKEAE